MISQYIVDFYCPKAHLIIELDGSQHYTEDGIEYDEIRTEVLEQYDLEVIRFTNLEIDADFEGVCRMIEHKVKEKTQKSQKPLSQLAPTASLSGEPKKPLLKGEGDHRRWWRG